MRNLLKTLSFFAIIGASSLAHANTISVYYGNSIFWPTDNGMSVFLIGGDDGKCMGVPHDWSRTQVLTFTPDEQRCRFNGYPAKLGVAYHGASRTAGCGYIPKYNSNTDYVVSVNVFGLTVTEPKAPIVTAEFHALSSSNK